MKTIQFVKNFLEKNKHLWILSYFVIYLIWFGYIERTVTTHFHVIHTAVDDWIPFCEYFIVPYLLWFGYVAWGVTYFAFKSKKEYYQLCTVLFTGMTIFLIVSTIYPNGHFLRPTYFTRHNIFTMLCGWLYATDTATNLFPSIHVYNSVAIHLAVAKSSSFKHPKTVRFLSGILCISIVLSTMFLKQHSFFDVLTGLLLVSIMYYLVYVKTWSKSEVMVPETSKEYTRKTGTHESRLSN